MVLLLILHSTEMHKYIRHITIHPLFFLCLAWIVYTDSTLYLLALLASIALHELGHILIYLHDRVIIEEIRLLPFGVGIIPQKQRLISRKTQAICALAGPIINLICAGICHILSRYIVLPQWLTIFYLSSLFLGLFNLLPILPLDGSRVLDAIASALWGDYISRWICSILTFLLGSGLLVFGVHVLLESKMNLSVCILGSYMLICLSVKLYQFIKMRTANVKSKP